MFSSSTGCRGRCLELLLLCWIQLGCESDLSAHTKVSYQHWKHIWLYTHLQPPGYLFLELPLMVKTEEFFPMCQNSIVNLGAFCNPTFSNSLGSIPPFRISSSWETSMLAVTMLERRIGIISGSEKTQNLFGSLMTKLTQL